MFAGSAGSTAGIPELSGRPTGSSPGVMVAALLEVRLMPKVQYPGQCAMARLRLGVHRG